MSQRFIGNCMVIENRALSENIYLATLDAPQVAEKGRPGQFVMIRTGPGVEMGGPLLKRPFSIHRFGPDGRITLLYRLVGAGTRLMAGLKPGDRTEVLGPLGRGFTFSEDLKQAYLVGGGIGLAPLPALAEAMAQTTRTILFYGARTAAELVPDHHLEHFPGEKVLCTDDGSACRPGFVTEALAEALVANPAPIFACGPGPMLAATAALAARAGVPAQVSLEAHMACGVGACLGCVVPVKSDREPQYTRVCLEGPVFKAEDVIW